MGLEPTHCLVNVQLHSMGKRMTYRLSVHALFDGISNRRARAVTDCKFTDLAPGR